jgi:hypothetical protein
MPNAEETDLVERIKLLERSVYSSAMPTPENVTLDGDNIVISNGNVKLHVGETAPENPEAGDLWIDTSSP